MTAAWSLTKAVDFETFLDLARRPEAILRAATARLVEIFAWDGLVVTGPVRGATLVH